MFPAIPDFKPLVGTAAKQAAFGKFDFIAAPIPGNKENISIQGDWARKNLSIIELTQLMGISGAPNSGKVQCHNLVADSIRFMFQDFEQEGKLDLIHTWGGMFCPRFQRGSKTALSNHAFGTAFDLNVQWNMLGEEPANEDELGCVYGLVEIANKHGWYWGGHFSRPDGMHFEYARIS
jgi:hypothetical protein